MLGKSLLLAACALIALAVGGPHTTPLVATSSASMSRIELVATGDVQKATTFVISLGAEIEVVSHDRIQAQVPADAMPAIEASRHIVTVARPGLFLPLQVLTPVALIGADDWHAAGFTGHGQRVAILDSGFRGYEAALGDTLPDDVEVRSFRSDGNALGNTDHGLRAAQVVHQVAPEASIYLVNFATVTELSEAVDYLIREGVHIVSFSLGYIHNGPGDGTGPVNEIVTRATDAGIAWAVSAGNWAQQHWSGAHQDEDEDAILEFAPGVETNEHAFTAGDLITVSLRWDEPWGAACSDYDIEVFGPSGALVRAARSIQDCDDDPVESLQVLATQTGIYEVRIIDAHSELPRQLNLMVVGSPDRGNVLSQSTPGGSLSEPADHPAVVTVGALTSAAVRHEAAFSSRGPTVDGRPKPEVLAPTGAANASPAGPFGGTSAAAPHVAGAMALLREAFPASSASRLRTLIAERSVDVPGVSGGSGAPRVDMGSLAGLGPLLPAGGQGAQMLGTVPDGPGLALLQYDGPDNYPARFAHLLFARDGIAGLYALDVAEQRWSAYIVGAPSFVNRDLLRLDDGQLLVLRFI